MALTHLFQISIYCLIFAASGILGVAEGGAAPSLLTFVIALAAYFFNERRQVFGLSILGANALALGAFGAAIYEFFGESEEAKLLSGTHLIVCLLWIVMFSKRELRHYWWICAMCLLHVALAAVLTRAGWYGFALIGYVVLMIWVLTLFALYRATQQISKANAAPQSASSPLASQASQTRGHVQGDVINGFVICRMAVGVLAISFISLLIGGAIFVLTPRVWMDPASTFVQTRDTHILGARTMTGFSEKVRLGDIGEILESAKPVLTLRAFNRDTNEPIDVLQLAEAYGMAEPYLRGSVLVNYRDGMWQPSSGSYLTETIANTPPVEYRNLVRQEITLEPLGTNLLFAMRPYTARGNAFGGKIIGEKRAIRMTRGSCSLMRDSSAGRVRYYVLSRAPSSSRGLQNDLVSFDRLHPRILKEEHLQLPGAKLKRLKSLALRIAGRVAGDAGTTHRQLAVARTLETYLRDSGEFRYSLDASVTDSRMDPVEDFLSNRKVGHCEYYAAALALMLRSVKIPSRLINGFKGGEYDPEKQELRVEQRHAHSWVEAFVGKEWITLDPTPAGEREKIVAANKPGLWESLSRDYWQFWEERVVHVSLRQQDEEIFLPLLKKIAKTFRSTADFREAAADFWNWLWNKALSPQSWFSLHGGLTAFVLMAMPVLLFRLFRRIWMRIPKISRRRSGDSRQISRPVEFYERFQRLLARRGMVRESHQTQREFGGQIQQQLDPLSTEHELENIGDDFADTFYRVRFGDVPLDEIERHQIDRRLRLLESTLKQTGR